MSIERKNRVSIAYPELRLNNADLLIQTDQMSEETIFNLVLKYINMQIKQGTEPSKGNLGN